MIATFLGIGALGWTAIIGAAGAASQVVAGQQQRNAAKAGARQQRTAQQTTEDAMLRQRKDAAQASARAARQQEQLNFNDVLAGEDELARLTSGKGATITGAKPPSPNRAPSTLGGY